MNEITQDLTDKQRLIIAKVIGERTITEGLRKAGVSRTSFYLWLRDPAFKAELELQRRAITKEAFDNLRAGVSEAVDVLRALLKSNEEGIRLRSAQTIIENTLKSIEIESLEDRITLLEVTLRK